MTARGRAAWVALGFLAIPCLLAPGLLRGEVFWLRDVGFYHWPLRDVVATAWREARLPLWSSWSAAGHPLLGDPAVGAAYPGNALVAALPSGIGLSLLLAVHLAIAGLGARALAAAYGAGALGAGLSGLAYAASGPVVAGLNTATHCCAAAWIPIGLLAARRWTAGGGPGFLAGSAASLAMQVLAGEAQVAAYTGAAMLLAAVADPAGEGAWGPRAGRAAARIAAVAPLALALAAVQVLPALEWSGQVERRFDWTIATQGSWRPWELGWELCVPDLLGCPTQASFGQAHGLDKRYLDHAWIGALPLLLVCAGAAWRRGGRAPLAWAVAGAWLALGRHGGLYWLAYHCVPGFAQFRYPDKALPFLALGLAVLAGRGCTRVQTGEAGRRAVLGLTGAAVAWIVLVTTLALLASRLAAGPLAPPLAARAEGDWLFACVRAGILAGAAATILWALPPGRVRPAVAGALALGATALDLAWVNGPLADTVPRAAMLGPSAAGRALPPADPREWRLLPVFSDAQREPQRLLREDLAGWYRHFRARMRAHTPLLEGRATLESYSTTSLRTYERLVRNHAASGWFGALGMRDVVADIEVKDRGLGVPERLADGPRLYRNVHALLRARLVGGFDTAAGDAVAAKVHDPKFPHAVRVVLDPGEATAHAPALDGLDAAAAAAGSARIVVDRGSEVVVETQADGPTLCVVSDMLYPGWGATVDGVPAPLLTANGAFRAVPVPAGAHRVVFAMHSRPATVGLWITALAALASLALALRRRRPALRS